MKKSISKLLLTPPFYAKRGAGDMTIDEVDELIAKLRDHHKRDIVDFDLMLESATALEFLRADALRYRHLRECNSGSLVIVQIIGMGDEDQIVLTELDADSAIDAALSAPASKGIEHE
jgi:hypothetical protein